MLHSTNLVAGEMFLEICENLKSTKTIIIVHNVSRCGPKVPKYQLGVDFDEKSKV